MTKKHLICLDFLIILKNRWADTGKMSHFLRACIFPSEKVSSVASTHGGNFKPTVTPALELSCLHGSYSQHAQI